MKQDIIIATAPETGLSPDECPFPGLNSYGLGQRHSFKGREQETVELARLILGQRMTILTAGSGDGKTSLIHAGLVPLLMREEIEVAVAEPGGQNPVAAMGGQLLARLVPLAADNLAALESFRRHGLTGSLRDVREALAERPSLLPRALWPGQRPLDAFTGGPLRTWLTTPELSERLLNSAMTAVARQQTGSQIVDWPGVDAPVGKVVAFLQAIPEHGECARLPKLPPEALATRILKRLDCAFALHDTQASYELVFVVDQFEEIFVQFRGSGTAGDDKSNARWQHRKAALDLLGAIAGRTGWPARLILSMRKEHYAELEGTFDSVASSSTYHLAPLHKDQALASLKQLTPEPIGEPRADKAQLKTWAKFMVRAIERLAKDNEGLWVDATQLSSLGRWLWRRPLPDDVDETVATALVRQVEAILGLEEATPDHSQAPGEPFADQLTRIVTTRAEQQEAIDILSQLRIPSHTGGGRRISLPLSALEARPWRSRSFRAEMIRRLREARLIRQDRRNEQDYVEIVHERLIDVVEQLRQRWKNPLYSELDPILDHLRSSFTLNPFARIPLSKEQFATLNANRERLALSDFAAARIVEAMLASPELWEPDKHGAVPAGDFLRWLGERVEAETAAIEAIDPGTDKGRAELVERALTAWRAGELVSAALFRALPRVGLGLEPDELQTWLITSTLFQGQDVQHRMKELVGNH